MAPLLLIAALVGAAPQAADGPAAGLEGRDVATGLQASPVENVIPAADVVAEDEYPSDLFWSQILWGGGVYLLGELVIAIFPPAILVLPFIVGYTVSEVAASEGYESDWFLPGLAALGGAFATGLCTWGGAIALCLGSGVVGGALNQAGAGGAGSLLLLLPLSFFVVGAVAQPFVAGAAATFTFQLRARKKSATARNEGDRHRQEAVAMAY